MPDLDSLSVTTKAPKQFNMTCLHRLSKTKFQDDNSNAEILSKSNVLNIHDPLMKAQLKCAGHFNWMSDERRHKQRLQGA